MPEDSSPAAKENDDNDDYEFPFLNDTRWTNKWLKGGIDEFDGARLVGAA
jgi:hypothetical protein